MLQKKKTNFMDTLNDEPFSTLPFSSLLCSAAKQFPDIIRPEEASKTTEICRHDRELYPRCADREINEFVKEVDGLSLLTVKNIEGIHGELSPFIPIANPFAFNESVVIGGGIVGIQLKDIYEKGTGKIRWEVLAHPLFQGKKVILFASGRDDLIEDIWPKREEIELFRELGRMGLFAITGMNFSVYECMCPFGQHYNIKKSLKFCSLAEEFGISTIPHFYAVNDNQRALVVAWLNANPHINVMAINCQSQKSRHDLVVLKETIRYFLEHTHHPIRIILEGYRIPNLVGLYEYLPYLHIAQTKPFMDGLYYRSTDFDNKREALVLAGTQTPANQRHHLVTKGIRARREYIAHLKNKYVSSTRIPPSWLPAFNGSATRFGT